jgi:hypothetical protein
MKKYLFFIFTGFMLTTANAQQKLVYIYEPYKNVITFEPLYFFNNGLKVNYERMLFADNWLECSLVGYFYDDENFQSIFGSNHLWESNVGKAYGYGFDVHYKWFPVSMMYLSGGFQFRRHKITPDYYYYTYHFHEYMEDGLTFIAPVPSDYEVNEYINRYIGCLRVGFQSRPYRRVSVGGYIGVNFMWADEKGGSIYSSSYITHNGIMPDIGFKLGVRF